MLVLVLIVVLIIGVVVLVKANGRHKEAEAEAYAAAHPIEPTLAEVMRRPDPSSALSRAAQNAVRDATPRILEALRRHREAPLLIMHSNDITFSGLLVVTSGRTLRLGGTSPGSSDEVEHAGAHTSIRASGPHDTHPFVEIANGGRIIRFTCSSITDAQLLCGVIDCWADNPEVTGDPRVVVAPQRVHLPDDFFADTLRAAGHPVTPYNMRSIYERFGMQLHTKAMTYIRGKYGDGAAERFTEHAGRPLHDRDLPGWPRKVLEHWIALDPELAHVAAFAPHQVRTILLDAARTGGYLANTGRPLCMWKGSDWYEDGGRGARRTTGPGLPPVPA